MSTRGAITRPNKAPTAPSKRDLRSHEPVGRRKRSAHQRMQHGPFRMRVLESSRSSLTCTKENSSQSEPMSDKVWTSSVSRTARAKPVRRKNLRQPVRSLFASAASSCVIEPLRNSSAFSTQKDHKLDRQPEKQPNENDSQKPMQRNHCLLS